MRSQGCRWMVLSVMSIMACALGCSDGTTPPGATTDAGQSVEMIDAGQIVTWATGSGSVMGTASTGATVRCEVTDLKVRLRTSSGDTRSGLQLQAEQGGLLGNGRIVCSLPGDADGATMSAGISFPAPPAPGTLTGAPGAADIRFGFSSPSLIEGFAATTPIDGSATRGSWTLTLSSVTEVRRSGASIDYVPHGSLSATMPDASSGTVTLMLTF